MPVVLAAVCLIAGCGGDDDGGGDSGGGGSTGSTEEAEVRQALVDYADALGANDPAAACEQLTEKAQAEAAETIPGASSCESGHRIVLETVGERREDVAKQLEEVGLEVEVDGDTAEMSSSKAPGKKIKMRREGGEWKVDQNTLTFTPKG
jgi:FAD/FMN-containing dehydrogenase